MTRARVILALALAAPLAGCFDAPRTPPPPPPENIFAAPADRALVKGAMTDVAASPAAIGARQFRQLVISDDPQGKWRAVCGQAAEDGGQWKDFVAIAQPGPAISSLAVRGDQLTPALIATCRPLVLKYVGARVSPERADQAYAAAGCPRPDPSYWWAWKSYCHGRLTLPAATPAPAAPQ